jgi:hypothetical protein
MLLPIVVSFRFPDAGHGSIWAGQSKGRVLAGANLFIRVLFDGVGWCLDGGATSAASTDFQIRK